MSYTYVSVQTLRVGLSCLTKVKQTNKTKQHSTPKAVTFSELPRVGLEPTTLYMYMEGDTPFHCKSLTVCIYLAFSFVHTRAICTCSFFLGKVTALGVLCCFALLFV